MCIVVTGAAKGIGLAVARLLANQGEKLVLVDVDEKALEAAELELAHSASRIASVVGSVADPECAAEAAHHSQKMGGAKGLSHNAGIQRYGTAADTSPEEWDEVLDVNLKGAYLFARALLPQLVERKGACVFMASVQGLASQQGVAAYSVSKHGLIGLAKSIAVDFAAAGVRSNAVAPGAVRTPMLEWAIGLSDDPESVWSELENMHPLGRVGEAEEIASVVSFLLSAEASFVTGEVVKADGGLRARLGGSPKKEGDLK